MLTLFYGKSANQSTGWVLIALGITSVFFRGGVFLRPTKLWQFWVALLSVASAYGEWLAAADDWANQFVALD